MSRSSLRLRRKVAAFTLIELLVVIAIIGILAAILIPTVGAARVSANKAKVKTQFSQWAAAMEQFKQEYGYYPAIATDSLLDTTKFLAALTAHDINGELLTGTALNGNRKKISFYSVAESELRRSANAAAIIDAFGNSEIVVLVDANGDGQIKGTELVRRDLKSGNPTDGSGAELSPDAENFPSTGIRATVLFYSAGRGTEAEDIVYSWK